MTDITLTIEKIRNLVDVIWGHAMEDGQVPSEELTLKLLFKADIPIPPEMLGKATVGQPDWVCLECGNSALDGFRTVTHHHAQDPDDHDLECKECGNLDIAESPKEAIATLTTLLDTVRAAHERLVEDLGKILNPAAKTYHWYHPDRAHSIRYPDLSDREMAGKVRMLYRTDLEHEPIVCGARDRIVHLAEIVEAAREVVKKSGTL